MLRALLLSVVLLVWSSGCYSEDWIIIDQRGVSASNFWARVVNFDGQTIESIDNYPLNPAGRTQLNISSPLPGFEVKDLTVTAWADGAGTRECTGDACRPLDGDSVVTLRERNWPLIYEIVFTP